jgi:hypothetical protein
MRPSIGELAVPSIDIATATITINQHTWLDYIQEVLHPEKVPPVLFLCRRASGHIKMVKGSSQTCSLLTPGVERSFSERSNNNYN